MLISWMYAVYVSKNGKSWVIKWKYFYLCQNFPQLDVEGVEMVKIKTGMDFIGYCKNKHD